MGVHTTLGIYLNTLESHLWEAANILRGPVDAADFKIYIFPLLFFKRISYVFDGEVNRVLRKTLLKYQLHMDHDLLDQAYGWIMELVLSSYLQSCVYPSGDRVIVHAQEH